MITLDLFEDYELVSQKCVILPGTTKKAQVRTILSSKESLARALVAIVM
jgi:hypothetical protein